MIASMPMNVCAKPEPGIEMKGELKPVAIAFASIVLPGARRAVEEQASLAAAARLLERLARLPEVDDPAHLLLRLGLAAHVSSLTPQFASPGSKPRICEMPISNIGPIRIAKLKMK